MKHKHHDLIMQWASNPEYWKIQYYSNTHQQWLDVSVSSWHPDCNFRLVPKAERKDIITFGELGDNVRFRFVDKALDITYGECITLEIPDQYWPNQRALRCERLFFKAPGFTGVYRAPATTEVVLCNDSHR